MLVFIDESGDPGFRVAEGASPVFAAVMVIFQSAVDARATEAVIRRAMERLGAAPEFKFNKTNNRLKEGFFQAVRDCPFTVRAIVVQKQLIHSPRLRSDKGDFYRYFVRMMMSHDEGLLANAKVVIDGSGDRAFKKELRSYLRRHLGDRVKDVRLGDSRADPLVQLADMCAGAIARSYRIDRPDPTVWRAMLAPRINDVWEFQQ
jgi:hypothetical protein